MATFQIEKECLGNNTYTLPTEIWEIILSKLTGSPRSVVAASQVCKQWRHLVTRICRKYCVQHLDDRLLTELLESAVTHKKCQTITENENYSPGEEWIMPFWMNHETFLDSSSEDKDVLRVFNSAINITSADPYLFVSTYNDNKEKTTLHIFNSLDYPICKEFNEKNYSFILLESLSQSFNFEVTGKVFKICILNLPTPVVFVITAMDLRVVALPNNASGVEPVVMFTNPRIKGHPKTSAEGSCLLTQGPEDEDYLLLYEASFNSSCAVREINLTLKCRLKTASSAYSWILSRGLVTTMETSGHIRTYKINYLEGKEKEDQSYLLRESGLKKDLRYPNPTLFTKDFLFSSTLVSRDLLGYWHMDRDRDYWLIGNISPQRSQVITSPIFISLQKVMLGQEVRQVVTAVHFERGVLLCGTKEGHLLGYKMSYNRDFTDENCFQDLTGIPRFNVYGVTAKSINRLGCLFTPFGLIVAIGDDTGMCSLLHIPLESPL